jgi:DNA repair protein RadC
MTQPHLAIKHWPSSERPREKLLQKGVAALSDAELLAIFLRTGCAGKSAVDLARELLTQFGGLRPLLEASQQHFCQGLGLGQAKYTQLQAVIEMARRHLAETLQKNDALGSPELVKQFLRAKLRHKPHEVFVVLMLDNQNRLLHYHELFNGTIDGASVYPREVVKAVLAQNAAAVIFAHNHPSGVAEPSRADHAITQRLKDALGLIDVRVLDHIVVGDGQEISFAEKGWL